MPCRASSSVAPGGFRRASGARAHPAGQRRHVAGGPGRADDLAGRRRLGRGGDDDRRPVGVGALPGLADLLAAAGRASRDRRRHGLPGRNRRPAAVTLPTSACWRHSASAAAERAESESASAGRPASSRQKIRVENFELTNNHFVWVDEFRIRSPDRARVGPGRRAVDERPVLRHAGGLSARRQAVAKTPADAWAKFDELHPGPARWRKR